MADIVLLSNGNSKRRTKKRSVKVDLTPMVDLGFLLITFFVFTTSMSEPTAMQLNLPKDTIKDSSQSAEDKTFHLILAEKHQVYYYQGTAIGNMDKVSFHDLGVRKLIIEMRESVIKKYGNPSGLVILIKPTNDAVYQDVVQVFDEMVINGVPVYMMIGPSDQEMDHLAKGH